MSEDASCPPDRLYQRVVELETLFMHLQRTVAELDRAVLAQQKQIEAFERTLGALGAALDAVAGGARDAAQPLDEKPPHY